MLARHLRISGWESWRVQWLRRLVDFSPFFSIFPFVAHRPQLLSLRGLSKLIHIDDRNLWSCGMQQGAGGWWWRQTPADNSWLCLMSNWHYNGCPHSRWNSPPVSAVSALNLLAASPEGTIGMFLHRLPHSLWSVLNRKLCSHFAQLFLWLLGGGGLLWLYEVIAIIVAHTLQTWINTITMQHLVWRRFLGPFPSLSSPSHAKNKCNLLLPICQKRKAKKGKEKREIAQSQCMCYKFQEKQKMISQKNNIWN